MPQPPPADAERARTVGRHGLELAPCAMHRLQRDAFTELRWITMQTAPRHYPF